MSKKRRFSSQVFVCQMSNLIGELDYTKIKIKLVKSAAIFNKDSDTMKVLLFLMLRFR